MTQWVKNPTAEAQVQSPSQLSALKKFAIATAGPRTPICCGCGHKK